MRDLGFIRRAVLAAALALSVTGVTAVEEGAQAMPVASALAQTAVGDGITDVQYMRYPHRRYRRYNRGRRAGLYRCGPGGLNTRLARRACR